MSKKILIDATGNSSWIGGLYYKKNIIFSLLRNKNILSKYDILIVTDHSTTIFDVFEKKVKIIKIKSKFRRIKLLIICKLFNVQFYFPYSSSYSNGELIFQMFGICLINWIPDFQHKYFPAYFSEQELSFRDFQFDKLAKSKNPLVLSSFNSLFDFNKFYNKYNKSNIYVVPFVSYIEEYLQVDSKTEYEILKKYQLTETKYICIMNQFWQHKNHIIVFKAIKKLLKDNMNSNVQFVFTGQLEDYRSPSYINEIKKYFNNPEIEKKCKILGFVDRLDQIIIMKNSMFIIQPSLFEGWGTVVEDAKTLNKTVLLSDIAIHREQMNSNCILFNPYDADELVCNIKKLLTIPKMNSSNLGIMDMYQRAEEYSKTFEQLLIDSERK